MVQTWCSDVTELSIKRRRHIGGIAYFTGTNLLPVVDDVNQPVVLIQNPSVQRFETVYRHPVIDSLLTQTHAIQVLRRYRFSIVF